MGVEWQRSENHVRSQLENLKAVRVKTLPHPGFSRYAGAITALVTSRKESTMGETVFWESLPAYDVAVWACIPELSWHGSYCWGQALGAEVLSADLRASADFDRSQAQGETVVGKFSPPWWGYYRFHSKLAQLGRRFNESGQMMKKNKNLHVLRRLLLILSRTIARLSGFRNQAWLAMVS